MSIKSYQRYFCRVKNRIIILLFTIILNSFLCSSVVAGAHNTTSKIELSSLSALVINANNNQILYALKPNRPMPIASITKLMTALVVLDAKQPLDEILPVNINETRELKGVFSRLRPNTLLTRRDMLQLALMSSENRAAASLAHYYPGGQKAFVAAMNTKAKALGMNNTYYVEPTGLSEYNVSTAVDLGKLLQAITHYPLLEQFSIKAEKDISFTKPTRYSLSFKNTNRLVFNKDWQIKLSKTGFINQAGHCLVMYTYIKDQPVIVILLNAKGKLSHFGDANRLRKWLETGRTTLVPKLAKHE